MILKPLWIPYPCCENFWCVVHDKHAHDCACPSIDQMDFDPYTEGGEDAYEIRSAQSAEQPKQCVGWRSLGRTKRADCKTLPLRAWCRQAYRTALGIVDSPADAQPFQVAGIKGTFHSHKQLERHCKANNMDLQHTQDSSWKKVKHRAKRGAEALATESGYSSLGAYKEALRDNNHVQKSVNEAKERRNIERS